MKKIMLSNLLIIFFICILFISMSCCVILNSSTNNSHVTYKANGDIKKIDVSGKGDEILLYTNEGGSDHLLLLNADLKKMWDYKAENNIGEISISRNGAYIAATDYKYIGEETIASKLILFDNKGIKKWAHDAQGMLFVSENGDRILIGEEVFTIEPVKLFNQSGNVLLTFNPAVVSLSRDGSVCIINGDAYNIKKEIILSMSKQRIYLDQPSYYGNVFTAKKANKQLIVNRKGNILWETDIPIGNILFTKDEKNILAIRNELKGSTIALYDLKGNKVWSSEIQDPDLNKIDLAWISDDKAFAFASVMLFRENNMKLLMCLDRGGKCLWKIPLKSDDKIKISDDGKTIFIASGHKLIKFKNTVIKDKK